MRCDSRSRRPSRSGSRGTPTWPRRRPERSPTSGTLFAAYGDLRADRIAEREPRARSQCGSLGGGNHFIEVTVQGGDDPGGEPDGLCTTASTAADTAADTAAVVEARTTARSG